jgi:hypothetical protein
MPKPKVAWFCAALWQDFTPPLTKDRLTGIGNLAPNVFGEAVG